MRLSHPILRRALTEIGPLIPNNANGTEYEEGKYALFINKSCAESNANIFVDILEILKDCVNQTNNDSGNNGDGIFDADDEWVIFLEDISNDTECLNNTSIDQESLCISNFRNTILFQFDGEPTCKNNTVVNKTTEYVVHIHYIILYVHTL